MNQVDETIVAINMTEALSRRKVGGMDLNDWHPQLGAWRDVGDHSSALAILVQIMGVVETLEQYDPREPDPYWYEQAAAIHHAADRHEQEAAVLGRWLSFWPDHRVGRARQRAAIGARRLAALCHTHNLM